eukprot:gb/GECG01012961.1/.p1 GENE.gb/GECG01012961.1/~~gb/GECG01012961.1/.p1  ORF type:complete len:702 (+),score=63.85 gb/GECG01012961.1/:1-2106(+)
MSSEETWSSPFNGPVCDSHGLELHSMRTMMPPLPLSHSDSSDINQIASNQASGSGKLNVGSLYPVLVSPRKVEIIRYEDQKCLYRWTIPYPTHDQFDGPFCQIPHHDDSVTEDQSKSNRQTPQPKRGGMLCASVNSKYVWMWPLYATNLNDSRHVTKISMHHTVAALHAVDNLPFFAVVHTNADFSVFDDKGVLMTTIRPSIYSESGVAPSVINTAASSLWLEQQAPGVYKFLVASLTRVKRPNNSPPKRKNTRIHADAGESDLDINFYSVYYNTLNEKKTLGGQDQRSKNVLVPAHTCTATESGCIHVNHAIRELPDPQAQRNPKLLIVNDPPCILLSLGTNFLYKFGLRTTLYDTDLAFPSPSLDANRRPFQWNIGTKELNDDSFTAKETDIGHPTSGVDILGDDKVLTSGVASDSGTLSFVLSTVSVRYLARISRQTTKCFTNLRKDEDPVKLGCSVFVNQVSNIAVVFFGGEVRSSSLSANDSGSLAAILKDHGARAPSEGSCSTPVTGNINEILSTLASQDATPRKRRRRNSKDVGTGRETNSSKMLEGPQGYDARESWENAWKALSKSQDSLRERWESKSASQIVEDAGTLLSQRGNDSSPPIDEGPLRLLISSLNECLAQKSSRMRSVMETVIRQILDDRLIVGVSSGEKTLCARLPYLNSLVSYPSYGLLFYAPISVPCKALTVRDFAVVQQE